LRMLTSLVFWFQTLTKGIGSCNIVQDLPRSKVESMEMTCHSRIPIWKEIEWEEFNCFWMKRYIRIDVQSQSMSNTRRTYNVSSWARTPAKAIAKWQWWWLLSCKSFLCDGSGVDGGNGHNRELHDLVDIKKIVCVWTGFPTFFNVGIVICDVPANFENTRCTWAGGTLCEFPWFLR
jgi:hypothetical protein